MASTEKGKAKQAAGAGRKKEVLPHLEGLARLDIATGTSEPESITFEKKKRSTDVCDTVTEFPRGVYNKQRNRHRVLTRELYVAFIIAIT
ncbi:hypothetical protein MTO96_021763 [Rhipicephalus appendiculatus]